MNRRAIFLDRDGTLCEEVGYINHVGRLRVPQRSVRAVEQLNRAAFQTVVVTNQSGVAWGFLDEDLVADVHDEMRRVLAEGDARLDGIYYCPHHPTVGADRYRKRCLCRKPLPGMFERARDEMGIDLSRSYTVGDRLEDIDAGIAAGTATVLVRSGYGEGEIRQRMEGWPRRPDHVAADLLEAVEWILDQAVGSSDRG